MLSSSAILYAASQGPESINRHVVIKKRAIAYCPVFLFKVRIDFAEINARYQRMPVFVLKVIFRLIQFIRFYPVLQAEVGLHKSCKVISRLDEFSIPRSVFIPVEF